MQNRTIIKRLGLTDQEVDAYITLLSLGGAAASKVASTMGIKRTTVYAILKSLSKKGFAQTYFKDNTRLYYAQKPTQVIQQQEKKLEAFENIIPMLQTLQGNSEAPQGLRYIETLSELKVFYDQVLEESYNKTQLVIGSAVYWEQLDTEWFIEYRKRRAQSGVRSRIILSDESRETNPKEKELLREWKYMPTQYSFRSTMNVFSDKIIVVSPKLSALAVVIQIPAMVDVFRATFEMLWDLLQEPDDEHK